MIFAEAFANGFVLENEAILEGFGCTWGTNWARVVGLGRGDQKRGSWYRRRESEPLEAESADAGAVEWGIFELMKALGCLKGCWCRARPFDKLRVTDRGDRNGMEGFTTKARRTRRFGRKSRQWGASAVARCAMARLALVQSSVYR